MAGRGRQLATGILINQLVILTATVAAGFALFAYGEHRVLDVQFEHRAAAIAQTAATTPEVIECLRAATTCGDRLQPMVNQVRAASGASFIVVIDLDRIRHTHPDPTLIGQPVEERIVALDGQTHLRIDNGSTGRSANALVPVRDGDAVIGEVSAGIRESSVGAELRRALPAYAVWFVLALLGGGVASWLLAQRLKRRTFGLELDEIALLLQEREATLHGIREGVIAFDQRGRVTMVNDEARRLLGLGHAQLGGRLDDLVPAGRLHDILSGTIRGQDQVAVTDDHYLVVNRMPVSVAGRPHGSVVTLRDRTEMSGLMRELDSIRNLTDALRAQQHEFSNRMHTVAGLLELGETDDALAYITEVRASADTFAERLRARFASPVIAGLLVGKAAAAGERGIALRVTDDTWLPDIPELAQPLTTILGNLIENAIEAIAPNGGEQFIEVHAIEDGDDLLLRVSDSGPGIEPGAEESIFIDGFTTKAASGAVRRGLGLALVRRLVQRLGGSISVRAGAGAEFVVRLPKERPRVPEGGSE